MPWVLLLLAGLLEIVWALSMKASDGFTRVAPSILTLVAMGASVALLAAAMRTLPVGTAYTVWTGIGAAGSVLFGALVFGEPLGAARLACLVAIVGGIAGLRLAAPG